MGVAGECHRSDQPVRCLRATTNARKQVMDSSPTKEDYKRFQRHLDELSNTEIADRRYQGDWGNYARLIRAIVVGRCGWLTANLLSARPSGTGESSG